MYVYYVVWLILAIFALLELFYFDRIVLVSKNKLIRNTNTLVGELFCFCLTLLSGFRAVSVGTDLKRYIYRFAEFGRCSWRNIFHLADYYSFEYGFAIFCKVLYYINHSPFFWIMVTSIIIGIGFGSLTKQSKLPVLTVFLLYSYGFFAQSMNIVRQFLAISICLISLKYVKKNNFVKFIILLLVASSIHTSALLFAIVYLVYNIFVSKRILIISLIIALFTYFLAPQIIKIVLTNTSYSKYLSNFGSGNGRNTLLLLIAIILLSFMVQLYYKVFDKEFNIQMWGLIIGTLLNTQALHLSMFGRIMLYYTIFLTVLIPNVLSIIENYNKKLFLIVGIMIIIFFSLYFFLIVMASIASACQICPYLFIWN